MFSFYSPFLFCSVFIGLKIKKNFKALKPYNTFAPDRFSRFHVYWIQNRANIYISFYLIEILLLILPHTQTVRFQMVIYSRICPGHKPCTAGYPVQLNICIYTAERQTLYSRVPCTVKHMYIYSREKTLYSRVPLHF